MNIQDKLKLTKDFLIYITDDMEDLDFKLFVSFLETKVESMEKMLTLGE